MVSACGQEVDCPADENVTPPDYADGLLDQNLRIHRLTVWENDFHEVEIHSTSKGSHDFCVTVNSNTVDKVDRAYGQLLDFRGRLKLSMRLYLDERLIGVYCQSLLIENQDWTNEEVTIFRAFIIDHNGNFNYRDQEFVIHKED